MWTLRRELSPSLIALIWVLALTTWCLIYADSRSCQAPFTTTKNWEASAPKMTCSSSWSKFATRRLSPRSKRPVWSLPTKTCSSNWSIWSSSSKREQSLWTKTDSWCQLKRSKCACLIAISMVSLSIIICSFNTLKSLFCLGIQFSPFVFYCMSQGLLDPKTLEMVQNRTTLDEVVLAPSYILKEAWTLD